MASMSKMKRELLAAGYKQVNIRRNHPRGGTFLVGARYIKGTFNVKFEKNDGPSSATAVVFRHPETQAWCKALATDAYMMTNLWSILKPILDSGYAGELNE